MSIGGDNNRVAGRDYYEYSGKVEFTVEQLRILAVVPSPRCEERVIQFGAQLCKRCHCEIHAEAVQAKRMRFAMAVLCLWGSLILLIEKTSGPILPITYLGLGAASVIIVFVLSRLGTVLRDIRESNNSSL